MSVKMIIGTLQQKTEVKTDQSAVLSSQPQKNTVQNQQSLAAASQQVAKVIQNSDAVVTTLRAFRTTSSSGEPIKDISKAEKVAKEVSNNIRENKEEALSAHDGVSSDKSAARLEN
jgi:hypothetical protein